MNGGCINVVGTYRRMLLSQIVFFSRSRKGGPQLQLIDPERDSFLDEKVCGWMKIEPFGVIESRKIG